MAFCMQRGAKNMLWAFLMPLVIVGLVACGDDNDAASESVPEGMPPAPAPAPTEIRCKDYNNNPMVVKPKTITIRNNSAGSTIYPVLATSKNAVNEWIQGCLRTTEPYPTDNVYKLYVNEGVGIAPGTSVTITLPLYSALSDQRYITWWNGGRVVLADKSERLREPLDVGVPAPEGVGCTGEGTDCKLTTYSSDTQFPENIYAQLSEYTFGDSIVPPGQSTRLLKPENVGYNISYVDHVYLPVAIEPKNNPYIGYSGSVQSLATFRNRLASFLNDSVGKGWPVYNLTALKLPGTYNVFAQRSGTLPPSDSVPVKPADGFPPVLTALQCLEGHCSEEQKKSLHFGEAVQRMQNMWGSCVSWNEDLSPYVTQNTSCPPDMQEKLGAIQAFFRQNHQQYLQLHAAGQCNANPGSVPVAFNYWEVIKHVYGWVPFNEGCGASANPLTGTSIPGWDHAKIQSLYIHDLQYNYNDAGIAADMLFNPYVQLIHGANYLSMAAYASSTDDAVGFMSELGDGLVFTVGGSSGLEIQQPFTYADGFSLAIGVPQSMVQQASTPLIKKYGVCALGQDPADPTCEQDKQDVVMPGNSQIAGFRVGTVASYPIKVRFTDLHDNRYTFVVGAKFAECTDNLDASQCPTNRSAVFDRQLCQVTTSSGAKHAKSDDWCQNANPNQQREKQLTKNYLSFPQPVDFM